MEVIVKVPQEEEDAFEERLFSNLDVRVKRREAVPRKSRALTDELHLFD